MRRANVETAVGLFVIAGILCLAYLSVRLGNLEIVGSEYVPLHAEFTSAAGLKKGAAVEIAGVEIGKVDSIALRDYKADVLMRIRKGIAIQDDTIASIRTRGLIGDRYINLAPGASDRLVPPGGRIRDTEPAVDLEGLLGQFIHGETK